jgi:hypothetical protein
MTSYKGWRYVVDRIPGDLTENGTIPGATIQLAISSKGDEVRIYRNLDIQWGERSTFHKEDWNKKWIVQDNSGFKEDYRNLDDAKSKMKEILKTRYNSNEIESLSKNIDKYKNK